MDTRAYAYKNRTEILETSSSGGAFPAIVSAVCSLADDREKTVIYGAAFDKDMRVVHKAAYSREDCAQFCGSKYVCSDMRGVCQSIAGQLADGWTVLFTGTPCQTAAVKAYVGRRDLPSERLVLADIACHGVPAAGIWEEYVDYLERRQSSSLTAYSFRCKRCGWKGYPAYAEYADGTKRTNTYDISRWTALFRKNLLLKDACFHCRFAGNFRSDLTMADFWGVEKCCPRIPVKGGVSLLLAHTDKGVRLAEKIREECTEPGMLLEELKDQTYLKYNRNLTQHSEKPADYERFWQDYERCGMAYVLHKYADGGLCGRMKFYAERALRSTGVLEAVRKYF